MRTKVNSTVMTEDARITKLIVKLNKETSKGNVTWSVSSHQPVLIDGEIVDNVYEGSFKGKKFRVYRLRRKPSGEIEAALATLYSDWIIDTRLDLIDEDKNAVLWTFNSENAIYNLYETVKLKVANLDSIFDEILSED